MKFDQATHRYTDDAGRVLPSVTTVINDLIPCHKADQYYLDRGTAIHDAAAFIMTGHEFDADPAIEGHITAIRKWKRDIKPQVVLVETMVGSDKYRYAGRLDLVAVISGKLTVIDWKSSLSAGVPYQVAAYAMALEEVNPACPANHGAGVELHADGTYKMTEMWNLKPYKRDFLNLLAAYNIRKQCKAQELNHE